MRKVLFGLLVLAVGGLMASPVYAQRGRGPSQLDVSRNGWMGDYRQAKDQAQKTGKPMMLVFRCVP